MDPSGQAVNHHLAAVVFADVVDSTALTAADERALEYLARAVELGAQHREWMINDPDWRALRDDPRFVETLDRIQR